MRWDPEKRFVVRADRATYRVDEPIAVTVDAFTAEYEPLGADDVTGGTLTGRLQPVDGEGRQSKALVLPMIRPGVFQTRTSISTAGPYRLYVDDPVAETQRSVMVEVIDASAERRRPVRDRRLQDRLAQQTGGRSYELAEIGRLPADLALQPVRERSRTDLELWRTPLWFTLVVGLMLTEWIVRRVRYLR